MNPPVTTEGILGRRRELDALRAWLDAARAGAGRLVLCVGEPGIGKTRLAQELAGIALARGTGVAWGRCVEAEGSPAFWPWRQALRSIGVDPDAVLGGEAASPEDRFRVLDGIAEAVGRAAHRSSLVVIVDDIHWADEPSLLALRHVADRVARSPLLVLATFRDVEPGSLLPLVLPDLLRAPGAERLELRGLGLEEVEQQLARAGALDADANAVLDLTGGNPLFVRELARAMADGTWRWDRPPRTVLDLVSARLTRLSDRCRRFVQAAAVVGRDFSLPLVAAVLGDRIDGCIAVVDEAVASGLVDQVGNAGEYRFIHALTRGAVEASLSTADRIELHRSAALALEAAAAGDVSDHLADIARHWAEVAPYGDAEAARGWAIRAADDAVRRLAFEEGVRLYRAALGLSVPPMEDADRCRVLVSLGRAAALGGDVQASVDAATAAAEAARAAGSRTLLADAALVVEPNASPAINVVAENLCGEALHGLGSEGHEALRARLLSQRSHLAYYDGDQAKVEELSSAALQLARASGDDRALAEALHARKEACPGPAGTAERVELAGEMTALASRTGSARVAMWGELWRIETMIERGQLASAAEGLAALHAAADRVGGPVAAWHHDRVAACIAEAQGRYADASAIARRAFQRMHPVEPGPARGSFFALQATLTGHIGVTDDVAPLLEDPLRALPRFQTMGHLTRAFLLHCAGRDEQAAASYQGAGPVEAWGLPVFYVAPCCYFAIVVAAALGWRDDVAALLARLEPSRGGHASGDGVIYLGPVELALGRGEAALGELDRAIDDLAAAAAEADRAGARGFAAEARYHLATALLARDQPGDSDRARAAASHANRMAQALGMAAYTERTAALLAPFDAVDEPAVPLSRRELEVAGLVAEGLTNRQIAGRLVISERTAQNHVQHILTKLGFTTRSQIAAWAAGARK